LILLRALEIVRRAKEDKREAASLVLDATNFLQTELGAVEVERGIQILHADHGVKITHDENSLCEAVDLGDRKTAANDGDGNGIVRGGGNRCDQRAGAFLRG